MKNMKIYTLIVSMFASTIALSLNEEELAKMSLQELTDLAEKQQKEESEIQKKSVALKKAALELTYMYSHANDECESKVIKNSFSFSSCSQMEYFEVQLNLNSLLQEEENTNLEHARLDAELIRTYITKRSLNS
jgi:hypothetical protein